MDWKGMPPLAALRAFAAFAQTGSVVQAGQLLNVSHAAISQQLRALETHQGVALLDRSGRGMELTEAGEHLAKAVRLGFGAISTAVQDLQSADSQRPVHLSTTSSFAAHWLMPRLPDFQQKWPEVNLMIDASPQLAGLEPGGIDLALRYGRGDWPGVNSEPLFLCPMVVVAAPDLLKGRDVTDPQDLADLPWIEELGRTEATDWWQARGLRRTGQAVRTQVPGNLLHEGARNGQGVAVSVQCFVASDIAAGRLVQLFEDDTGAGYHIVTRPGVLRPPVKALVAWLRRQASEQ